MTRSKARLERRVRLQRPRMDVSRDTAGLALAAVLMGFVFLFLSAGGAQDPGTWFITILP